MVVLASTQETRWRTVGPYLPTLASKAALLEETRLFLVTLGQQADLETTIQTLVNLVLGQRSRETRMTIAEIIRARLARWNPPAWVLQDLVSFANAGSLDALRAALLLHVPRQDHLLYDFVQAAIVPRWQQGESEITVAHAQTFFDKASEDHPETARWGFETRLRLARGLLATLRDYGLLRGTVNKQITLPVIPLPVVHHLIRLLQAEGVPEAQIANHQDWRLWLWSPAQAQAALDTFLQEEQGA
jgi:hypothetical protein